MPLMHLDVARTFLLVLRILSSHQRRSQPGPTCVFFPHQNNVSFSLIPANRINPTCALPFHVVPVHATLNLYSVRHCRVPIFRVWPASRAEASTNVPGGRGSSVSLINARRSNNFRVLKKFSSLFCVPKCRNAICVASCRLLFLQQMKRQYRDS
jgi:hypothetical protein